MSSAQPRSLWIKICGMTTPEAIEAALAAHVDAIGFVFSPSPRQLAPADAARLAAPARGRVPCIAVTRHPSQQVLDEIVAAFVPDLWQSDYEDIAALRSPRGLGVLPVLRTGGIAPDPVPPRVLFEGPVSGAGVVCDWTGARDLASRVELILAGGLTAETVRAGIEAVGPFGVDVSSGVEDRPGLKSAEKILSFAQAARAAFEARLNAAARVERNRQTGASGPLGGSSPPAAINEEGLR